MNIAPKQFFDGERVSAMDGAKLFNELTSLIKETNCFLKMSGFDTPAPATELRKTFLAMPAERQARLLNDFALTNEIYCELEEPPRLFDRRTELNVLSRFLKKARLRIPQDDLLDRVSEGDIIEIYDMNNVQIYRSWNCFRVSSYSLAELLVFPFDVLYDRPSWVLEKLMSVIGTVLGPDLPIVDFNDFGIPEYVMNERFHGHDR